MIGDLARAIRERECILFAGAGVSMTVGLPSWRTLMDHMGAQLGFGMMFGIIDKRPAFADYVSNLIGIDTNTDNPRRIS